MPIRIELVDQHEILRDGLRRILEGNLDFVVVAEAASEGEAVEMARRRQPDVAIVDLGMRDLDGLKVTTQILQHSPGTRVLVLSLHTNERYVARAVKAGARGYLLKDDVEADLAGAIQAIHSGKSFISPAVGKMA
jgi:DNA-binding NarL/FixJ family response regulator